MGRSCSSDAETKFAGPLVLIDALERTDGLFRVGDQEDGLLVAKLRAVLVGLGSGRADRGPEMPVGDFLLA